MKGINGQGNVQKGFITPVDLWEETAKNAQKQGIAVSDVLREGMILFNDGKLKVKQPWQQGRKRAETTTPATPAKTTPTPAKKAPAKKATGGRTPARVKAGASAAVTKTTASRHLSAVTDEPQETASVPAS